MGMNELKQLKGTTVRQQTVNFPSPHSPFRLQTIILYYWRRWVSLSQNIRDCSLIISTIGQ